MIKLLLAEKNHCFIVYTDNTTTKAVISNQKSKHTLVNKEWKAIQKLLEDLQCNIVSKQVTSGENTLINYQEALISVD
jgi:hypothetical protein